MTCFAKPVLTEDLYIVQKEEFSIICTLDERPIIFTRDKPILLSERMLHKDHDHKGSVGKENSGRESQGAWCQDKLIGSKLSDVR
jgi:hypothetical protein